jgi:hypothetical protein
MITRLKKMGAALTVCLMLGGAGAISGNAVQDVTARAIPPTYCENNDCDVTTQECKFELESNCSIERDGNCEDVRCPQ